MYTGYTFRASKRKKIAGLRALWGREKTEPFNFNHIGKYAEVTLEKKPHLLSKQTMNDIDFLELFAFVDRTTSRVGQQFLFNRLLQPQITLEPLLRLDAKAALFATDSELREGIQQELLRLNTVNAYFIPVLMQGKLLEKPEWFPLLYVCVALVFLLLIFSLQYPVLLIYLIIPVTINAVLHYWNKTNTFNFIQSFPQLNVLIEVSKNLCGNPRLHDKSVEGSLKILNPFKWKLALLNLDSRGAVKDDLSQISSYFTELIKSIFLIEVFVLFHLITKLEKEKESVAMLFAYVGEIDSAISVASIRAGDLQTCKPDFIEPRKEFSAKNIYHPLIESCVKNDLHFCFKSIIVSGSNMSGKSTFLRTLIVNSILAQTIYTCFADEFKSPLVRQFSSIRIDDNLFEGKSNYMEAVTVMGTLVRAVEPDIQNMFVLDEVFKGTNTVERIAAAKAILSYLNRQDNLVIVSTHDIELCAMLENEYDLYHFAETIENEQLNFDHKIKAGPLKTRNAIRILEMAGYPAQIIEEAKSLSANQFIKSGFKPLV
jgi:DNA mismatch repair ATPase MutS